MASTSHKRVKHIAQRPKRRREGFVQPDDSQINLFEGPIGSTSPKYSVPPTPYVVIGEIENTRVHRLLEFQGWLQYLSSNMKTKPSLVDWFYKYFKYEYTESGYPAELATFCLSVTLGDGTRLTYDNHDFDSDFGIPGSVVPSQEETSFEKYMPIEWPRVLHAVRLSSFDRAIAHLNNHAVHTDITPRMAQAPIIEYLTGDDKFLLKIVREIVLPTGTNDNKVSLLHSQMLCMLKHRVRLNLPALMVQHMAAAPTNKKSTTLPYGGLITHICEKWGVPSGREQCRLAPKIGKATYIKQGSILLGRRLVQDWEASGLSAQDRAEYDVLFNQRLQKRAATSRHRGQTSGAQVQGEQVPKGQVPDTEVSDEHIEEPQDAPEPEPEPPTAPRLSVHDQLEALRQETQQMKRRQGRMMRLLRLIGEKVGCSSVDIDEAAQSSPEP